MGHLRDQIKDPKWFDDDSKVGWVRISDATAANKYLVETRQRLSLAGIASSRPVDRGSLIMSICATVGRPVITHLDVCIHDGFVVFTDLAVDQEYLYYFLTSIEDKWKDMGQTGSQMNLNTTLIENTEMPLPPTTDRQHEIAQTLATLDAELRTLETQLTKARALKAGMMGDLLTGRVRLV